LGEGLSQPGADLPDQAPGIAQTGDGDSIVTWYWVLAPGP
jgi:hypothetical protein